MLSKHKVRGKKHNVIKIRNVTANKLRHRKDR